MTESAEDLDARQDVENECIGPESATVFLWEFTGACRDATRRTVAWHRFFY